MVIFHGKMLVHQRVMNCNDDTFPQSWEIPCRRSLGKILPWRQPEMFDPLAMKNRWEKWWFTLWLCQNSYWTWWFIVDFSIKTWWFSIAMLNYQRVTMTRGDLLWPTTLLMLDMLAGIFCHQSLGFKHETRGFKKIKSQVLCWRIIGISLGDLQGAGAPFMSVCKVLGFRYDLKFRLGICCQLFRGDGLSFGH